MQKVNAPTQFVLPFAGSASSQYRNTIPIPSQQPVTPGAASFTDGFPPVTMEPTASGGIPPYGADMNGILYVATLALQWQQAGFVYPYNNTFATNANVGGYPAGALLGSSLAPLLWLNKTDNNQTNPDAGTGAGWLSVLPNGGQVDVATTGGTTTLTPNQLTGPLISVTGTLTSNATLVLPLVAGSSYVVQNATTGAFTLTVKGATGAGVVVTQGSNTLQAVVCDGSNWYSEGLGGGPYLPLNGTAQAAVKLATARAFSITGKLSAGPINFDGTGNVVLNIASVTADKLATPRAFQISGLASAAAINFDGTGAVTLNVTALTAATPAQGAKADSAIDQLANLAAPMSTRLTDWDSVLATPGAKFICSSSGSNNGPGGNYYVGINIPYYSNGFPGGQLALRLSPASSELWFRCASGGNPGPWLQAMPTTGGTFSGDVTVQGLLTCTTFNASSSDRRMKRNIHKVAPRPLHRNVPFVSYVMKDSGFHGRGSVAQDVMEQAPEHVGEFQHAGKRRLSLNYAGLAYEQAMWAGLEIDRLLARIERLEQRV